MDHGWMDETCFKFTVLVMCWICNEDFIMGLGLNQVLV